MSTVISVENLGKKYTISHQQRGDSSSLREVITNGVASFTKKLLSPFTPSTTLRAGLHPDSMVAERSRSSEDFWALKDVSFEVKQGDRIGIIGRNGAGKSTLLKILSRITEPTTGSVRIKGRVASLLEVGTGFHPELTGRENIYLNGAILGMGRQEISRKFDEIVAFAEIEKFLDTPVKRYSSGMYVRLAFAVAAHLEPEILIVDEVLAVGDVSFQKKCLGKMEDVGKQGRTVLFVSHNMGAIRTICDRGFLLGSGRLLLDKSATFTVDQYLRISDDQLYVREWDNEFDAPRNSFVKLIRTAVCDNAGQMLQIVTTDTEFRIEIIFEIICSGASVGVTLLLNDTDSSCIFSSINNSEPNWYGSFMPAGIYRTLCVIPGNFLNNRTFSVDLNVFGMSFTDLLTVKDVLKFEVQDGINVRKDYFGDYAGYIRPDLLWITERL